MSIQRYIFLTYKKAYSFFPQPCIFRFNDLGFRNQHNVGDGIFWNSTGVDQRVFFHSLSFDASA